MRCLCLLLLCSRAEAVISLDDYQRPVAIERFTAPIKSVQQQLEHVTRRVADQEARAAEASSSTDGGETPPARLADTLPDSLADLADGIQKLRRVRDDVSATDNIAAAVKVQVLWNLDRMVLDVGRLHSSSLVPLGRAALVQALNLRFGVLLTPAFWSTPIKRALMAHGSDAE